MQLKSRRAAGHKSILKTSPEYRRSVAKQRLQRWRASTPTARPSGPVIMPSNSKCCRRQRALGILSPPITTIGPIVQRRKDPVEGLFSERTDMARFGSQKRTGLRSVVVKIVVAKTAQSEIFLRHTVRPWGAAPNPALAVGQPGPSLVCPGSDSVCMSEPASRVKLRRGRSRALDPGSLMQLLSGGIRPLSAVG